MRDDDEIIIRLQKSYTKRPIPIMTEMKEKTAKTG